jgi:tetratricopeptide (TPR) repeat protein
MTVDPNSAHSFLAMGRAEWTLGRCDEAIAHIKEAFRLSPRDPRRGFWHLNLGLAEVCPGRLDAAVEEFKRASDVGYRPRARRPDSRSMDGWRIGCPSRGRTAG